MYVNKKVCLKKWWTASYHSIHKWYKIITNINMVRLIVTDIENNVRAMIKREK